MPWAGTRQNMFFLKKICQVPGAGPRQNKFFKKNYRVPAVRHSAKSDGRWPPSRAGHLLPSGIFAECRGTRQSPVLPRARLYRVPGTRQSRLCRVLYFTECGTRQNIALPSAPIKSTRQSLRHSAKYSFPVVNFIYEKRFNKFPNIELHNCFSGT